MFLDQGNVTARVNLLDRHRVQRHAGDVLRPADLVDGESGENWSRVNILLDTVEDMEQNIQRVEAWCKQWITDNEEES